MTMTERLLEATKEIWDGYNETPFVKGIADGSLDHEKFKYYMIQDYLYLLDYTKVFSIGTAKAKNLDDMRLFAGYTHSILDGEMDIHRAYMTRLGIAKEEAEQTPVALDNLSYTSYMLDEAYKGGPLEILVAVLSCAWSYQMIGEHHQHVPGALEHPLYGEWVRGYCSKEYCETTQEIIDLVNELGKDISAEREAHLKEIFENCSRYEAMFWDMAYEMKA